MMHAQRVAPGDEQIVWLDNFDVMQLLKICGSTLALWRKKNLLRYYHLGGKIFYKRSEVDDAIVNSINNRVGRFRM